MMIPVQRLTKYELLLKKIHQLTEEETKRNALSEIVSLNSNSIKPINLGF